MRKILIAVLALVLGASTLLVPHAAEAETLPSVLGSDGTLYRLHVGKRSEILPASGLADTHLALLEIRDLDGKSAWQIVPGTDEGADTEKAATLIYEPASESLFLVWETRINYIHSVLNLVSYGPDGWSEVIRFRGGWVSPRSTPQAFVTRDHYPGFEEGQRINRMILHLVWWEANEIGEQILYAPAILENGEFVEIQDPVALNDIEPLREDVPRNAFADALLQAPAIRGGEDANTVVIGFADLLTGLLRTVEVRAVPGELTGIADELRSRIVDFSSTDFETPLDVATAVRRELRAVASDLHPGVQSYLAQSAFALVAAIPAEEIDFEQISETIRNLVIEEGDHALGGGLVNFTGQLRSRIVDFSSTDALETPSHAFAIHPVKEWDAPITPETTTSIFLPPHGRSALIAWISPELETDVTYIESLEDGWTEPRSLHTGANMDFDEIYEALRGRAASR